VNRARVVGTAVVAGGLLFGFAGGEYGSLDWWQLRRQVGEERRAIEHLETEIDSLRQAAEALEHDPLTQERVAREAFGMLRSGEMLYRVETVKP
jgi:cell division protein FtsB